jgi:hypothetical protein
MDRIQADRLLAEVCTKVRERFPVHPYASQVNLENFETVMGNYLVMSTAFPYIQAGAVHRAFEHHMQQNAAVPHDLEITAVVGAFLAWDELGGHLVVSTGGNQALPKILDTRGFHANMLRLDRVRLLGREVAPCFSDATLTYLRELLDGLAACEPAVRVAHMVAFEMHAEIMIESLWRTIAAMFAVDKERLTYFHGHVGGVDPAEAHHVTMTRQMIAEAVQQRDEERLFKEILRAYELSFNWCDAVTRMPANA